MTKDRKIFLPLTLDSSTKTAFSGKQLFGFFFFGLVFLLMQLLILKIRDIPAITYASWLTPATIIVEIVLTYFIIFLIRKIVIKEDKIMQNYQTNQALQKTELDFMWDIFAVKDGKIRYCSSGREAVIIRLTHGYLLDRPLDQEEQHKRSINAAISTLCKQGYKFIYFNRENKDPNLEPLADAQRKMIKYKGTRFYETANKIIQHTYSVCSDIANTEQEYYVIFADTMEQINKLDYITHEFIHNLDHGVYVKVEALDDEEIWKFFCDLYGLKFIDKSRLLNKMFENNSLQLIDILEINRDQNVLSMPENSLESIDYSSEPESEYETEQTKEDEEDFL